MAAYCKNCGTELIAGQRFCRMCGAPISESQREELPTKIFPGERQAGAGAAASTTASQPRPSTDPFSPFQQPTASQPPVPQQTTPLYLPPDQATPRSHTMMFLVIGLIGMTLLAALLFLWNYRQPGPLMTTPPHPPHAETGIPPPPEPPPPDDVPGATLLDESDAVETAKETVITKTYPLGGDATFSIKGMNGNVKIEGWDEAEAEVKVIKRGGSVDDRKMVQVKSSHSKDQLSFQTSPIGGGGDVDVLYEVKLPRGLRQVEIRTINATVKVEKMSAAIEVKSQSGSVELEETSGTTVIKLVNGQIKADYEGVKLEGAQELSTVNGRIEVKLDDDANAELDAKTVSGSIELDGDFGFKVEKKIVGQKASGRIGTGGEMLSIGTVNGPIKISK